MSRYDGLIIPRSYSEYINKTDAATLQQALQLSGVLSGAVAAGDNKAVTSNAVNGVLANYIMNGETFAADETTITRVLSPGVYLFLSNMHPLVAADHMGIYAISVGSQPTFNKIITYIQDVSLSEITISVTDNNFKFTTRTVFRGILIKLRDYVV